MKYRIGIDVGGTNTDLVLLDTNIIKAIKVPTTQNIEDGVKAGLQQLDISPESVSEICLGTTHATNAILQCNDLYRVGVIRIAGHNPQLPPCYGWPTELKNAIFSDVVTVNGGLECHGTSITPLKHGEIRAAAQQLIDNGAESIAVVGVFSPLNPQQELIALEEITCCPLSLSHQIGGLGYIERENSTILNASLKKVMQTGFKKLQKVCTSLGFSCPIYIIQNNGSRIDIDHGIEYPVLTISAGPTNSFIGGTKLTGLKDAIVMDIGGTSTDIGIIRNGFPRRCLNTSSIGGVSLNFPMPDVISLPLGGGSIIGQDLSVGPKSCARKLLTESMAFGGMKLTLTDIAIKLGYIEIPGADPSRVTATTSECKAIEKTVLDTINKTIDKLSIAEADLPIVAIGGGTCILKSDKFIIPDYSNVANAFGAALAEITSTIDTSLSLVNREKTLEELKQQAVDQVIAKGGNSSTVKIVDMQIIPYYYMPNQMARVVITASS